MPRPPAKLLLAAGIAVSLSFVITAAADDGDLPLVANPFLSQQEEQIEVAVPAPTISPNPSSAPPPMRRSGPPIEVHERHIDVVKGRPGMQSFLLYAPIRQPARTYGPALDTIRAVFSDPVDVHGLSASVDLNAGLFELEAGINQPNYGGNSPGWLFHYTSLNSAKIEESIMFPQPFRVNTDDYLSLTAWISNDAQGEAVAQPEVIVFFTPA
jgi:hypothetical protein